MFLQPLSGLGRLLKTASSQTLRGQSQPESVTEELHTYDLLYPDGDTLIQGQHHDFPLKYGYPSSVAAAANSSDDKGGLELQSQRDIRIIIAQEMDGRSQVLHDTHPPLTPNITRRISPERVRSGPSGQNAMPGDGLKSNGRVQKSHTAPHSRHSSISQTLQPSFMVLAPPLAPVDELSGLLGNPKLRKNNQRPATSDGESDPSKIAREEREETEALLLCMFGATGLPKKATTKLHVRPVSAIDSASIRAANATISRPTSPRAFAQRRTPLTRSTTTDDLQGLLSASSLDIIKKQASRRKSSNILITKLFTVDPPVGTHISANHASDTMGVGRNAELNDYRASGKSASLKSGEKVEQVKTPTFAIAMVISVPPSRQQPWLQSSARLPPASIHPNNWLPIGLQNTSIPGTDFDSSVDYVISQWTIFTRALASLEIIACRKLNDMLAMRFVPPSIHQAPEVSCRKSNQKEKRLPLPALQKLSLDAGELQDYIAIQKAVTTTVERVASALRIRRVIAGQNRWGIWRGEARWVGKWAGGREQNFFLFNLLTAFLGCHTAWLDALGPSRYRRRHARQQHQPHQEVTALQNRTIIVSADKMASRRLIFLLAAFLPNSQPKFPVDDVLEFDSLHSSAALSFSPSWGAPTSRRQSLRRTVNRNTVANQTWTNARTEDFSLSISSAGPESSHDHDISTIGGAHQHSRRPSDVRSIRSAALPIASSNSTRKSSTTTTATVRPGSAVPVPHFSSFSEDSARGTGAAARPGSSGSLASLSLQRTLSRSESNEHSNASIDSNSGGRWGSMVSSFWSDRRGSSTEHSDLLAFSDEGLGISGMPKDLPVRNSRNRICQIVEDTDVYLQRNRLSQGVEEMPCSAPDSSALHTMRRPESSSPSKPVQRTPLKLSIDENDGIIDVDLPFVNSCSSSFESTMNSPVAPRTNASSFNDKQMFYGPTSAPIPSATSGPVQSVDVAGWLRNYHEDFMLQAVSPYNCLREDIKRSMRAERTPVVISRKESADEDGWTDVCTTLIADTSTFSVTRLTLRRKRAWNSHHQANALPEDQVDNIVEEDFTEEPLMDMDATLTDAVEKVLSHSGQSSNAVSRASSPTRQKHRRQHSTSHASSHMHETSPALEIPHTECKKTVLGALEEVARSVSAELGRTKDADQELGPRNEIHGDGTLREGVRKWLNEVK